MRALRSLAFALSLAAAQAVYAATPAGADVQLLSAIPDQAVAAAVLHKSALALPMSALTRQPELRSDVSAYLTRVLGVDLTRAEGAMVFALNLKEHPAIGGLLRLPPQGALHGRPGRRIAGNDTVQLQKDLYAVSVPAGVAFGTETALAQLLPRVLGKGPSGTSPLAALLQAEGEAELVVALSPRGPIERGVAEAAERFGVTGAALSLRASGPLRLSLYGEQARLSGLRDLYLATTTQALSELKQRRDRAQTRDDMEGLGDIVTYHTARQAIKEMEPRIVNGKLVSEYQMPLLKDAGAGAFMPMVGVLAAVAIPAFTKYVRRSKSVEATVGMRRIYDGVVLYHASAEHGKRFKFPHSTEWTPRVPCCQQEGGKCQPDAKAFANPTWRALNFTMDQPHAYQYRFQSEGQGPAARFVIEARGDLNCDGTYGVYRREGRIEDGKVNAGPVQSDRDLE